jgi:GT2 family glycosyltransferase
MKVGVVIVDYNNHKDTRELLESRKNLNTKGLDVLWLVVDNGSDTPVSDTLKDFSDVVWLQTGKNLGFAGGYNAGMKHVRQWGADYIFIVNNDILFKDENLIFDLIETFNKDPKIGVVSPKIYFAPNFEFYKEKYKNKDKGSVIWYAGGEFNWDNIKSIHRGIDEVDTYQYDLVEEVGFVSGASLMIKREVLDTVGYFNEKLFAYFEDNDFMERVKKVGYKLYYNGKTSVYHKVSRTSGIGSNWSDYLITRNRLWFGMKYAKIRTKLSLIREAVRFLILGRSEQKKGVVDYLKGVWGWYNVKRIDNPKYSLDLSILIINYKTTILTLNLLDSLFNKNSGFDSKKHEVIVLDNSPEDSCKDSVLKKYPNIKLIQNSKNNGFAGGNNQLIDYSLGKNVLLLNSDILVKENGITNLLKANEKYGDDAIYVGKLLNKDGSIQKSVLNLPTITGAIKEYFFGIKNSFSMYYPQTDRISKVECAVMACFMIPKKVIQKIGKLDESNFMYFEDIEYCKSAGKNNIPIYYVPDAEFVHLVGESSKKAGDSLSRERLIKTSKKYHGVIKYYLLTGVLWLGQKIRKII